MTESLRLYSTSGANITPVFNNRINRSQSGQVQIAKYSGGYFKIALQTPNLSLHDQENIISFLYERGGNGEAFNLYIPKIKDSKGGYNGVITVNGADQTGGAVNIQAPDANTLILKQGDFIKFDNGEKVYKVTRDVTTDGGGLATLYISPNLISIPADSEEIIYRDVPFLVIYAENEISIDIDVRMRVGLSLPFEEAFLL